MRRLGCVHGPLPGQQESRVMKFVFRLVAALLFLFFFVFALKNTQEAALQFFWGYEIRSYLVLMLLAFFVGGAVIGVFAMLPTLFRYRREVSRHKQRLAAIEREQQSQIDVRMQAPPPDGIVPR
jgi:lipopolysaccharide assembly protein A